MDLATASSRITVADIPEVRSVTADIPESTITSTMCCGIKELSGLSHIGIELTAYNNSGIRVPKGLMTPERFLRGVIYRINGVDPLDEMAYKLHCGYNTAKFNPVTQKLISCAHVIYNQAVSPRNAGVPHYGDKFTVFLLENKLGEVTKIKPTINPNSKNELTTYIWTVNHDAVFAWWEKHRKDE